MWNSINHYTWAIRAILSREIFDILLSQTGGIWHAVVVWALYVESGSSANMHDLQSYRQF